MYRHEFTAKDGTAVVFREPAMSDAKPLMKFINSVIRETRSGIIIDKPFSLKEEEEWLGARLREIRRRTEVILVAEVEGRIAGSCHISRRLWKERHRALVGIVLSKEARGKGVGRAIMTETMNLTRSRMPGLELFELSFLGYNKAARTLYKRLGFVESCRIPDSVKEGDDYIDETMMFLRIGDFSEKSRGKGREAVRK